MVGVSELRSITRISDVIVEAMISFKESGVNVNDDPPVEMGLEFCAGIRFSEIEVNVFTRLAIRLPSG